MPFKSLAQMKYMFTNHPVIAERWAREGKTPKKLPEHVKKKKVKK